MSPELRLVAACARWPDDEERRAAILETAKQVRDWSAVESLADAHRLSGFVAQAVSHFESIAPSILRSRLADRGQTLRSTALLQTAETLRLSQRFAQEGIQHRILKGMPLGVAIYGTPSMKQCWDIDILVMPSDAIRAVSVLREVGYQLREPFRQFGKAEFDRWSVVAKDMMMFSPAGFVVELHWRVSDFPTLLQGLDAATAGEDVDLLGSRSVPVFSRPANLAYLAVHGAFHGWSRLKWLADFAALLRSIGPGEDHVAEARRFAPGRALDQALSLSNAIFGVSRPATAPDPNAVKRMVQLGCEVIALRQPDEDIDSNPRARVRILQSQWLVQPSLRYRLALAAQVGRGSEDRQRISLPKKLTWLYWVLRPFTATYRSVARRVGAPK